MTQYGADRSESVVGRREKWYALQTNGTNGGLVNIGDSWYKQDNDRILRPSGCAMIRCISERRCVGHVYWCVCGANRMSELKQDERRRCDETKIKENLHEKVLQG